MATTINVQTKDFIDFDFKFEAHPTSKNLMVKRSVNAVRQSVINLLQLRKGDKPHHPEIFSPIGGYLFENASAAIKKVMENEIFSYLEIYEPRILMERVIVSFPDNNSIDVQVDGMVRSVAVPVTINILVERLR